jgi:guanylate kinase
MMSHKRRGLLFILVGPTGAGKNTLMNEVLARLDDLQQLPTATTRAIRPTEKEGREHHFVTRAVFEDMINQGDLLEHQNVHGRLYGVPRKTVADAIEADQDRIADIDVLGAMNVRVAFPDNTIIIFVQPGASDDVVGTIRQRLEQRGEPVSEIEKRLERIPLEMSYAPLCDYMIINDNLADAIEMLHGIILAERSRRALLNLRARKDYPRHRIRQVSAALVSYSGKLLLHQGDIPMVTVAPGEYPNEAATRALPAGLAVSDVQPLGITTEAKLYYDQLTFWYHTVQLQPLDLPDGWAWGDPKTDAIPLDVGSLLTDITYSK